MSSIIIYTVIFRFEYLSISVLLKNEENILELKLIRIERENAYFICSKIERFLEATSECSIESSRIID